MSSMTGCLDMCQVTGRCRLRLAQAGRLPAGARLVKAFGTLSAPTLSAVARREPERAVLFYTADDAAAGDLVAGLIRASGHEPVRVGGLDQSIRIKMF
jgi:8-hydroxy-5-deazaflavin:NADPH oxidoreductase